jgi:hypothetical protein
MRTFQCYIFLLTLIIVHQSQAQTMHANKQHKIKITVGNHVVSATLNDSPAARDFMSLLPFTVELKDYARTEKIYYLPEKLSTKDAPEGSEPKAGNIAYYAPWGNLAIFYKDFEYSSGLIILGKIDGSVEVFKTSTALQATFEWVQ